MKTNNIVQQLALSTILLLAFTTQGKAQSETMSKNLSLGFQLNQYQNDFGIGAQITSPYFLYDKVAVRARGNAMFLEHLEANEYTWTPYSSFSLGFIGSGARVLDVIHLYGEGGVLFIAPADNFSSSSLEVGGYGLFGFEFHFFSSGNYFIELGGIGSGATADKVPFSPIYSNGFSISTGFRFFL